MCDARQEPTRVGSQWGFSLIEVLISILITTIVMGAVFGLLTRGQRAFRREPEVADLQQSARGALAMVSRDILQGGAGLPPEFPAFSRINGGDFAPTDAMVIFGSFQSVGNAYPEPEVVAQAVGDLSTVTITLQEATTNLQADDGATPDINEGMVLIYNNIANLDTNDPTNVPQWLLGDVVGFPAPNQVLVNTGPYAAYQKLDGKTPGFLDDTFTLGPRKTPMVARVSMVRYSTQLDGSGNFVPPVPQVLMRETDFSGNPQAVGYLEDFQIRYVVGVTAPIEQDNPPAPAFDTPGIVLDADNTLSSVRVSITARSVSSNMEGASEGASAGVDDNFIRKTFATNVNPRNMTGGIEVRALTAPAPP